MKINLLMFYQDDPKKCTAAKLIKLGLGKKIIRSQSKTALLHPFAKKTLFNHEKSSFNSITGIDCSCLIINIIKSLLCHMSEDLLYED